MLPQLAASIPPSIHLNIAQDRTTTIRASVHDVEITVRLPSPAVPHMSEMPQGGALNEPEEK